MNLFVRKNVFLCLILILSNLVIFSQDEYKAEIGIQAGGNIYAGDVNTIARPRSNFLVNLKNIQPDFGAFFKYRFNPRISLRLGYDNSSVAGTYIYTDLVQHNIPMNNKLHMIDMTGEFNFFDLENNPYKRFSKKFSPFVYAGLGYMLMPSSTAEHKNSMAVPFGFGLKVKLAERWNFHAQWSNRLLLKDNLEGLPQYDNPDPKTFFNPMNNDLLSGIHIGISYDFWRKGCDCNENVSSQTKTPQSPKSVRPKPVKETKVRRVTTAR